MVQDWHKFCYQSCWLWTLWEHWNERVFSPRQGCGCQTTSEVAGPWMLRWLHFLWEIWCRKSVKKLINCHVLGSLLIITISVGIWCDMLGDFQWRESPLSWHCSNWPAQNAIGRAPLTKAHQCCLQWWNVSHGSLACCWIITSELLQVLSHNFPSWYVGMHSCYSAGSSNQMNDLHFLTWLIPCPSPSRPWLDTWMCLHLEEKILQWTW